MKTATIDYYHVYGTRGMYQADVMYRGKRLYSATDLNVPAGETKAQHAARWALEHGFTHYIIRNS